jgi:hypothetical protein
MTRLAQRRGGSDIAIWLAADDHSIAEGREYLHHLGRHSSGKNADTREFRSEGTSGRSTTDCRRGGGTSQAL